VVSPTRKTGSIWLVVALLMAAAPASAVDYQSGKFKISWGNTLSYGAAWRVEEQTPGSSAW